MATYKICHIHAMKKCYDSGSVALGSFSFLIWHIAPTIEGRDKKELKLNSISFTDFILLVPTRDSLISNSLNGRKEKVHRKYPSWSTYWGKKGQPKKESQVLISGHMGAKLKQVARKIHNYPHKGDGAGCQPTITPLSQLSWSLHPTGISCHSPLSILFPRILQINLA